VDTPADNRLKEITQQSKGHSVTLDTNRSTRQRDEAIWRRGSSEVVERGGQNNAAI
jgi:hypothetical protein